MRKAEPKYLANGVVTVPELDGLELLLFKAFGAQGTRDTTCHAFDFVKGIFGCASMLKAILRQYLRGDLELLGTLSVQFVHAGSKGK